MQDAEIIQHVLGVSGQNCIGLTKFCNLQILVFLLAGKTCNYQEKIGTTIDHNVLQ